jgi:hypothetical protein
MWLETSVAVAALLLVTVNGVVTRSVWGSSQYTREQQIIQTWLVWCVPVVGSAVVVAFLRSQHGGAFLNPRGEIDSGVDDFTELPGDTGSDTASDAGASDASSGD